MNKEYGKLVEKSLTIIRNLPGYMEASRLKSYDGSTPKDYTLNRCLKQIERIKSHEKEFDVGPALVEAWRIYMDMQSFGAAGGERQDYRIGRETSLDAMREDELWVDGINGAVVENSSPEVYSGGLGYRHVNWDSSYLMAQPVSGHRDGYYDPREAAKRRPVKHYTREEIDKLSGTSG